MRQAVVDVGSNSLLLTVEEFDGADWLSLLETSEVTGLGDGTKQTGLLKPEAIDRTLLALRRAFDQAAALGVAEPIAAATMAARMAKNSSLLLRRAAEQQTPLFILSAADEAELGFQAVLDDPTFSCANGLTTVDIGGQSTEIVVSRWPTAESDVAFKQSLPIGTLGIEKEESSMTALGPAAILASSARIDDILDSAKVPLAESEVVALGASVTNIVSIRDGIEPWDPKKVHGASLTYEEVSAMCGRLMAMSAEERGRLKGMERGREGTIHMGALILERILFALKAEKCRASVRGWRHALLEDGIPNRRANVT